MKTKITCKNGNKSGKSVSPIACISALLCFIVIANSTIAAPALQENTDAYLLTLGRIQLRFSKGPVPGLCGLTDKTKNRVWADSDYKWKLEIAPGDAPDPTNMIKSTQPEDNHIKFTDLGQDGYKAQLTARMVDCTVIINYQIPIDGSFMEEQITIVNKRNEPIRITDWDFGPARRLNGGTWPAPLPGLEKFRAAAVPWRRQIFDAQTIQDYDLKTLLSIKGGQNPFSPHGFRLQPITHALTSDAWALINDTVALLVTKYAPSHIEYSVLRHETREGPYVPTRAFDNMPRESRNEYLLFGGSMRCRQDPTPDLLPPSKKFVLGLTRYDLYDGDWREAFDIFKTNMNAWGNGLPQDYETFIHWNELYDNKVKWYITGEELVKSKQEHYLLKHLRIHAQKAVDYSCETLYLDPGWDTNFASSIKLMKQEYGLKVALHTPLAGWCNMTSYPKSAYRLDQNGKRLKNLCGGSKQYLQVKAQRLRKLAADGASFLMFDGSFYTGRCYDPTHGHSIPYTRDNHMMAYKWLAQQVHEVNPDLKIEMHELMTVLPYCPVYLGYRHGGGWDEMWGYEMMWSSPAKELLSGKAIVAYYFNLAYDIPIYLHINLSLDNENALGLWWFASTVRHLGIGGTHKNPEVVKTQQEAMKLYRSLKRYFVNGKFVGLHEMAHLHTLPDETGGVLNLFNIDKEEKIVTCDIPADRLKVKPDTPMQNVDAKLQWKDSLLHIECSLPTMAPKLLILKPKP